MTETVRPDIDTCSFCGQAPSHVKERKQRIVCGTQASICYDCIMLCHDIVNVDEEISMSHNVNHTKVIFNQDAHFTVEDFDKLIDELEDDKVPERCFVVDMADRRGRPVKVVDGKVPIEKMSWESTGSGHLFDVLTLKVAPKIKGTVMVLATWEDGDPEIWHIKDGQMRTMGLDNVFQDADFVATLGHIVGLKGKLRLG